MTVLRLVCLLLGVVQVPSAYGHASDPCVATFTDFEKATISDNPDNVEALVRAIYKVNRPFPLSLRVDFHSGNSSNRTDIISTDPNCPPGKEIWLWVSSPVLVFVEPTKLNMWALYTLRYFSDWIPRHADIYVPSICNSTQEQFNFFDEFMMRVQTYAASSIYGEAGSLGNVLRGCGDGIRTTLLNATLPNNEPGMQRLSGVMMHICFVGIFFLIVLVSSVLVIYTSVRIKWINRHTDTDAQPLYGINIYGVFCGCVGLSAIGNILLSAHTFSIAVVYLISGDPELGLLGKLVLAQLAMGTIITFLLASWFGLWLDISIPVIFSCTQYLCTCCEKNRALYICIQFRIERCLSLWSLLSFTVHIACRMIFVLLALLAEPSTVMSTLAIYLFAAFLFIHFVGIIFTVFKQERRPKKRTFYGRKFCQFVLFFSLYGSLFAVVMSFGLLITAANSLAVYGGARNSINAVLSTVVTPVVLAGISWVICKSSSKWLRELLTLPPIPSTSEANEQISLLVHAEAQMEEGTVPGGQGHLRTRL